MPVGLAENRCPLFQKMLQSAGRCRSAGHPVRADERGPGIKPDTCGTAVLRAHTLRRNSRR